MHTEHMAIFYVRLLLIWSQLFLVLSAGHASGDPDAGKAKANLCISCHGLDGNSSNPHYPKLAGQRADYIFKQTVDFKSGKRKDAIMSSIITTIPAPDDLLDIAAYFAAQPVMKGQPSGSKLARKGKDLFEKERCIFCHEAGAKPVAPALPATAVIGGQHKEYLVKAMLDIRSRKRTADIYNLMYKTLNRLSEDDIRSIAEYLSGL